MTENQSTSFHRGVRSKSASPALTSQRLNFQGAKSLPTEQPPKRPQSAQYYSDEYTKAVYGECGISPHHFQRGYHAFRSASVSGTAMKTKSVPVALGRSRSISKIERNSPLIDIPYRFVEDKPSVNKNVHAAEDVADEYQRTTDDVGMTPVEHVTGSPSAIRKSVRWAVAKDSGAKEDLHLPRITHRVTTTVSGRRQAPEKISHSTGKERRLSSVQPTADKATTNPRVYTSTRETKPYQSSSAPSRSNSAAVEKCNIERDVNAKAVVKSPPQVLFTSPRRPKPLNEILARPEIASDKEASRPLTRSKSSGLVRSVVREHRHTHSQLPVPPRLELTLPARIEPSQLIAEYKDLGRPNLQADAANPTESLTVPKEWLKRGNSISPEYCDIPHQASPEHGSEPLHTKAGEKMKEIKATIDFKNADKMVLAAALADALMAEAPSKNSLKKRLGGSLGRMSMRSVAGLYGSIKGLMMDRDVEPTPDFTLQIKVAEPQEDSFSENTLAALDKAQSKHAITASSHTP